jgi:ribosome-binding protein aMBF1 (putative translation factor)
MATPSDRWSTIRERTLTDPAARERYEQTRRSVLATRRVLQVIDAERKRAGLTKAELAERIGTSPAAVRRLLTSESANPTLRTVLDLFDALNLEVALHPRVVESTSAPEESAGPAGLPSR